jgi:glutathione S-transferase
LALQMYDLAGADDEHRFSPYCWRTRMACAHKGLPLETIPWRFCDKDALPQPNSGTVPVLVDGDTVVADSWKIAGYLDERYPERSLVGSEAARGAALLIKYWTERTLHPLVTRMCVRDVWAGLHEKDKRYFRDSREQRLGKTLEETVADRDETRVKFAAALEPVRAVLAEQPFVCGKSAAYADYIVFGVFQWERCVSSYELLEESDPVHAWRQRLLDMYGGLAANAVRHLA